MAKSLFKSLSSNTKKKRVVMIQTDLASRLEKVELRAEKVGFRFPLNEHVEDAISRLVFSAEKELTSLELNTSKDINAQ